MNLFNDKEDPDIPIQPYAYDYVNARPIYVEDTAYLTRHPYRFDEWIPKSELHKIKKKPSKPLDTTLYDDFESRVEDVVNSMLD